MISVLVPYYNDEFLPQCIDSILAQSFTDFELILLNHGSTDNSEQIAKSYNDKRIKHINLPENYGAGGGLLLREFLELASGKYCKFFCADDIMHENCLKDLCDFLDSNPHIDVCFGNMRFVEGKELKPTGETWWTKWPKLLKLNEIDLLRYYLQGISRLPFPASILRLEILRDIKIDKVLYMQFDMTIWVQLLIRGYKFKFIDNLVCDYRLHEKQTSSSANFFKIHVASSFESIYFIRFFSNIKSIELIKKLLPYDVFAQSLKDNDTDLIPFIIAHYNLRESIYSSYILQSFFILYDIMSDDIMRRKIKLRFGYELKDFRKAYSETLIFNQLYFSKFFEALKIITKSAIKKVISLALNKRGTC